MDEDRMATAAEAVRALRPPPLASESWVRANTTAILEIVEKTKISRAELAHALVSAGVAQKNDRVAPLHKTALARALSLGRRNDQSRRSAIDLQKIESAVAKAVGQLLPGLTDELAKKAAAEALRLAQADGFGAAAATPQAANLPAVTSLETASPPRPSLASAARLLKSAEPTRADLLYPQAKGTQR